MPTGASEEAFEDATSGNEKHSARNPACDLCREKKVRCGREKPRCQNCIVWKANCTYSERQKRDNEASRNAQRFEEVNERLDRIENTMSRLLTALESAQLRSPPAPPRSESSPASSAPATARPRNRTKSMETRPAPTTNQLVADKQGDLQYLGPSSLLSFTSEAETLVEERLKASAGASNDSGARAEQNETIGALRKLSIISSKSVNFFPHYGHKELRTGAEGAVMGMPPKEEADMLVNEYFLKIHHWFPIFDEAQFRKDVESFYQNPDGLGKVRAWQLSMMPPDEKMKHDPNGKRVSTFFYNAWSAIDDLEVFLRPRLINVQALISAAVCAIEVSRPGLCWSLLSQAARTAQAIGLHRNSSPSQFLTKAQCEERKYVFWNIYIMDKCLSLSFGRSTCLPDYDCDVDLPEPDDATPFFKNFLSLIALAKIHSQIYVRLYSASATRHSEDERERAIKDLDAELRAWWDEWSQMFTAQKRDHRVVGFFEHVELQFSYHSSMTLVHRMSRPGMPSYGWSDEQCLENARSAIRIINDVVVENPEVASSGMLLWLFQYYPFTSFFVLFSAIIRNPSAPSSSSVDYPLMKALVSYLNRMKSKNEGAAKLQSIASAFTHVAGTFLKNYLKLTKSTTRAAPQQKRRREEPPPAPSPFTSAPTDDGWIRPQSHPAADYAAGTGFYSPVPPTTPQQQRNALSVPGMSSSATTPSTETDFEGSVDLQAASFLKWPGHNASQPEPAFVAGGAMGTGTSTGDSGRGDATEAGTVPATGEYDIDLEALMAEPVGFQMQMQEANLRGPLEFDWFRALDSWDGAFGVPDGSFGGGS